MKWMSQGLRMYRTRSSVITLVGSKRAAESTHITAPTERRNTRLSRTRPESCQISHPSLVILRRLSLTRAIDTRCTRVRVKATQCTTSTSGPLSLITCVRWHSPELWTGWICWIPAAFQNPTSIFREAAVIDFEGKDLYISVWWFPATPSTLPQERDESFSFFDMSDSNPLLYISAHLKIMNSFKSRL